MTVTSKAVPLTYVPAAWAAPTFKVAPTVRACVPEDNAPVAEGVLAKELIVIVLTPLVRVRAVPGNVMAYVYSPCPFTVNAAAETVPAVAGSVTLPVRLLVPSGVNTTVPPAATSTATLPKFISTVLVIDIGVTIVAVAVADAFAPSPAKTVFEKLAIITTAANNEINFFISFFLFLIRLKSFFVFNVVCF